MEEKEIKKIKCKVFKAKNKEIDKLTKAINAAGRVERKAQLAEKLKDIADSLLTCEKFDPESVECKICHYISSLRERTANLIIRTKNLKSR